MFRRLNPAWYIAVILHLLIAAAGIYFHSGLTADSQEYLIQAQNLRRHFTFYCGDLSQQIRPELYSLRPPGYGIFLAMFSWGDIQIILPVILQVIISMCSLLLAWKCTTIITGRKINAVLFLLPLTAFLPQLIYTGMIMSEIVFQFAWTLAFCSGVMLHHSGKIKWAFAFQIFITAALLIKPVAWLLPLFFVPLLIYMIKSEHYPLKLIRAMLIPLLVIALMFFRNYTLTGVAEYSSVSNKLLINYNIPPLLESKQGHANAHREIDSVQAVAAQLNYKDRAQMIRGYAVEKILGDPANYAYLHLKGLAIFFLDTGRWEWRRYFGHALETLPADKSNGITGIIKNWNFAELAYYLYCVVFNLLLVVAMLRFVLAKKTDVRDRRLLLVMILYIAILTGPSASARFRIPVFPLQLVAWGYVISVASKSRLEAIT
jgi:hypothetical protein